MAIIFKKKTPELSVRQVETLVAAGLMEAPEQVTVQVTDQVRVLGIGDYEEPVKRGVALSIGSRVRVNNPILDNYMRSYKSGDEGIVLRRWGAVPEAKGKFRAGIAEVQFPACTVNVQCCDLESAVC
jgi:hypothetical protein